MCVVAVKDGSVGVGESIVSTTLDMYVQHYGGGCPIITYRQRVM